MQVNQSQRHTDRWVSSRSIPERQAKGKQHGQHVQEPEGGKDESSSGQHVDEQFGKRQMEEKIQVWGIEWSTFRALPHIWGLLGL